MTARRRRKSGSGPSATALIAWVGARQTAIGAPVGVPASVIQGGPIRRMPGSRAVLVGRACGVAAGTLLACGSVLVSATHVGDGPLVRESAPLPNRTPAALGAGTPEGFHADAPPDRTPVAPELVSAQAVAENSQALHPRLGQVRRNNPVSVNAPVAPSGQSSTEQRHGDSSPPAAHAPRSPITPVRPVLDPATERVGRVAPVGGVLAPTNPSGQQTGSLRDAPAASPRAAHTGPLNSGALTSDPVASVKRVVTPVDKVVQPAVEPAAQPAMAMLTSLLPIG
jgi:hypothetical protein